MECVEVIAHHFVASWQMVNENSRNDHEMGYTYASPYHQCTTTITLSLWHFGG